MRNRAWTLEEDELVLQHEFSDDLIAKQIQRSKNAVTMHRSILKKEQKKIEQDEKTNTQKGEVNETPALDS